MSSVKQSAIWELQTRQLLLPKLGHELSECEDAIAIDAERWRFAVADGATEAFDARTGPNGSRSIGCSSCRH